MVRNPKLKRAFKKTLTPVLTVINAIIPKKDTYIMLYSANRGIQHSLVPLKNYLLNNGYEKKYTIIACVENLKYADEDSRLKYMNHVKGLIYFFRSKYVFYTTGQYPIKPSRNQKIIHLCHGNVGLKPMGLKLNISNGNEFFFTYMITASDIMRPIMAEEYGCSEDHIVVLGDVLTDELFIESSTKYEFGSNKMLLLWTPTFRQSDYLGYVDSSYENIVPLFEEQEYEELNNYLRARDIHIIVKLHPEQRVRQGGRYHFSHLDIYTHEAFVQEGYDLYLLMKQADGLIGDYSSLSMQYLLLDRPQAFVVPDMEEYAKKRGFLFDDPEEYMAGHIVRTKEQFFAFIGDISSGRDLYREKRKRVRDKMYRYQDGDTCKRIVEFCGIR